MASALTFCLLLIALAHPSCSTRRTLRSWLNPGCEEHCQRRNVTTLYLRADGANDTLHYLWDFTVGRPSVLLALTSSSAWLNITWPDYLDRRENTSVHFSEPPVYTFGVIVNKIIEFNDVNETALINTADAASTNVLHPENFNWRLVSLSKTDEFVYLDMEGNSYHDKNISRYGSIKLSMRGFCTLDHSDMVPHMLHTENSTQVDIVLDNIQTNQTFSKSRFAIELLVVGRGDPEIPMFVDPKKSLDDEHTPGIFEVVEVRTPPYKDFDGTLNTGAYLQWRPVSYSTISREVTSSTETMQYPPKKVSNRTNVIDNSMLYCYYGNDTDTLLLQKLTVSIGSKGDGFYKKMSYSTWTFIIGYGTPPEERFSNLVIMIISIGLGLPLLIMIIAGLYLCIRKMPKRQGDVYLSQ